MKKLISLMLVLGLVMAMLAGCVVSVPDDDDEGDKKPVSTKPGGSSSEQGEDDSNTQNDPDDEVTIEEVVIYDENDILVAVTGLGESYSGPELKLRVENNTDKNIVFSADEFVINGVTVTGFCYVEASAGKKANDSISFFDEDLEIAGIDTIATIIGVDAHIVDSDSYETLYEAPFSVTTSAGDTYVQTIDDSGDVVFQDEGITVIAQTVSEGLMGQRLILLAKNETDKDVTVEAENISVNGYTMTAWMYDTVYDGSVRFCELQLYDSELEENGVEEIEEITFTLRLVDSESYETIAESDEIQVFVTE